METFWVAGLLLLIVASEALITLCARAGGRS